MYIKNIALSAAALATALSFASGASAANYFAAGNTNQSGPEISTQLVQAEAAGVVRFYDENGRLIDSQRVHAGANHYIDVDLENTQTDRVVAVLEIGGQAVAEKVYIVRD